MLEITVRKGGSAFYKNGKIEVRDAEGNLTGFYNAYTTKITLRDNDELDPSGIVEISPADLAALHKESH